MSSIGGQTSRPATRAKKFDPTWLLAVPIVVFLVFFFLFPVYELARRSFFGLDGEFTLFAYQDFFATPAYVTILLRTFWMAFASTLICAVLAYPYAYLMTIVSVRQKRILLILVLLPFWTSLMVRTYAWLILLQDTGPIKALLSVLGLGSVSLIRSTIGVLIGMTQILLPFMVLPLYNNLTRIKRTDLQAAQSLGATPSRAFWRVYFPQSLPGLLAGGMLVFILSLGFYITPVILGSPQTSMMSQLIVRQVSERLDWASGGAMAVVLGLLTLLIVGIAVRFIGLRGVSTGSTESKRVQA